MNAFDDLMNASGVLSLYMYAHIPSPDYFQVTTNLPDRSTAYIYYTTTYCRTQTR